MCMYTVPYQLSSSHHGAVSFALKRDDMHARYYVHGTHYMACPMYCIHT